MGVPALFRWLSKKYPKIIAPAIEEQSRSINGYSIPVDLSKPNPNGFEVDNLYLDMNGIIHPCTHPEDRPAPATEDEAMLEIFNYIDRIFAVVRPRKLLYMAIDGVAPRAKMNQQRSRRFRAAQEANEQELKEVIIREELLSNGKVLPPKKQKFDSNCITPGTPFMARLAQCLRYFVAERISNKPTWANIKVILSDASVPGEGEHKIMDFIRRQRLSSRYDPNTRHVLHGLDADLIMLALATHEPHFKILREDVFTSESRRSSCNICGQSGHKAEECLGQTATISSKPDAAPTQKPFIFLDVSVLREYLAFEMHVPGTSFAFDLERALDDWVFLCFFVGNDFLPHIPSLEIREGAIDKLLTIYKRNLSKMGGYLTDSGDVDLDRVQLMMRELGSLEDEIFRKRKEEDEKREMRQQRYGNNEPSKSSLNQSYKIKDFAVSVDSKKEFTATSRAYVAKNSALRQANISAARSLRESLFKPGSTNNMEEPGDSAALGSKRKFSEENVKILQEVTVEEATTAQLLDANEGLEDEDENKSTIELDANAVFDDDVRLWEPGWRERYYRAKFKVEPDNVEFRKKIVIAYTQGLCWVLKYYYQGCQSWKWFFPYNYSPFAMDFNLVDLKSEVDLNLDYGKPFRPFEQLMAVLPAASKDHIPPCFWPLMTEDSSPIIEYYPEEFQIDLNGKKHSWQGVVILPFIDENRLLDAMRAKYEFLSEKEKLLNSFGEDILLVGKAHVLYEQLCDLYKVEGKASNVLFGLSGTVKSDPDAPAACTVIKSPLPAVGLMDISNNQSIRAFFVNPSLPNDITKFEARLLPNVRMSPSRLNREDFYCLDSNRSQKPKQQRYVRRDTRKVELSDRNDGYYQRDYQRSDRYLGNYPYDNHAYNSYYFDRHQEQGNYPYYYSNGSQYYQQPYYNNGTSYQPPQRGPPYQRRQ